MVNLPRGAQVSPLDGSGDGVTINFNGPIYSVDDFDEAVNKARLQLPAGRELDADRNSSTLTRYTDGTSQA